MQMLADGVYTITASVTDLDGLVGNQEIEITVGTPTPPLLNDTFDAPLDMGVWTIVDEGTNFAPSNWFVDLGFGVLRQTSNIFGGSTGAAGLPKPGTYLLGGDLLWDDYTFSASMETTDDDAMGMMFRYQGSDDYYRFSMDSQRGYLRLVKKVGGVFTSLFEDAFSFVLGQSYDVEVITSGADIQISIDGTAVINVTDAAFATGQIALYSWGNDGLSFDDVSVTTGGGGIMTPPVVMISMPADGSSFASGATITFAGSAIDAEDGDITGILSWTSVPSGLTGTGSPVMDVLADGVYTITASVTDSHGFVDSDEVTVIVQNATGTLLLSNDFSSALTWTIFDEGTNAAPSNWFVDSGVLRQTSNIYGGSIGAAGLPKPGTYVRPFPGNPGWTDYTFSARMKSTDDDGMGMMFRYQDDDNYYRFSMDSQRGYRRLVKKVAGVFTLLFEDTFSFVLGQWSQVEVVAGGDKIVIYIDGQLWNIAMDSDLPDGQIGLYSWGNEGLSFDDVFVFEDAYRIQPPVVTISEPFDGEVFATLADITFAGSATDPQEGDLTGNLSWTSVPSELTGTGSPVMQMLADGVYTITASVTDMEGLVGNQEIGITVGTLPLLNDTFDAPLDPLVWTIVDEGTNFGPSNWFVDLGVLRQTSNIFGGSLAAADLPKPGTYLLGGDVLWTDYTFSVSMQTTDDDAMGMMFRYEDADNYYRFSMDS